MNMTPTRPHLSPVRSRIAACLRAVSMAAALLCWSQAHAATVQAAPAGSPVTSRQTQLASSGYLEEEFFLRGQAQAYTRDGEWEKDGKWAVKPHGAAQAYETRLLVRRPKDPARFNGIVVVEWLNTTMGFDLDGGWILTHDEIEREGYAWVGVSAEAPGVQALKAANATRYAQMQLARNDLAFDIYTQAAQAIRQAAPGWGASNGQSALKSVKLLGLGYSQSAVFLTTYLDAIQPIGKAYDGFYMRSTAPAAPKVDDTESFVFAPQIRADLNVPVMQLQTEMEVMVSWPLSKTQDTDKVRYWEIPGASHFDKYLQEQTLPIGDAAFTSVVPHCFKPVNTLPARMFDHAALHALRMWVGNGTLPPKAPRMQRGRIGFIQSDDVGNAQGGLRLPELDAPVAQYGMYSNFPTNSLSQRARYACVAGGSTNPLDAGALHARYANGPAYVEAYTKAADKLLKDGFLRPADHAALIEQAKAVALPK
ncbi:MAG: alpha/beta hydrolase domain-containing protein [Aquabacterium sp.]